MDNISIIDKITGYAKYTYKNFTYTGPYKRVIFNDKLEDYKKNSEIMNSIHNNTQAIDENFSTNKRVLVSFLGNKKINTVIIAKSYTEINDVVNFILENQKSYPKKTFGDLTNFVDKICLLTNDDCEINITDTLNTIVQYKEQIKISDLPLLHKEQCANIKSIKITHYSDVTFKEITIDFIKNKDQNVDILNEWILKN